MRRHPITDHGEDLTRWEYTSYECLTGNAPVAINGEDFDEGLAAMDAFLDDV